MIEKFEKRSTESIDGVINEKVESVAQVEATHKHICYHDEKNPKPCRLIPIK